VIVRFTILRLFSYKYHDYSIMSKAVEFEEILIMIMIMIKIMVKAWPAYQVLTYNIKIESSRRLLRHCTWCL